MTNGFRTLCLLVWTFTGCESPPEENDGTAPTIPNESQTTPAASQPERRQAVNPENLCEKFIQRASADPIWDSWVERMNENIGDCTNSVSALETSLDEQYPNHGRRILGVYDRCIDESQSPADYWLCVQEDMPSVVQRLENADTRPPQTQTPRGRKGGERSRPRGQKGRGRR